MYAVVGCSECRALWVVEGSPETTSCPRCGKRHVFAKRKRFFESEDAAAAKQARAALLAKRQGHGDAFADLEDFRTMGAALDEVGASDEEYLGESGLDPDEVAAAGERSTATWKSRSRTDVVRDAIAEQESPDEDAIVAYADDHGVPADYVRKALEKLVRAGEASETRGTYRLV
ncbi:MAG: DUF5817 domain-containing protein [Halanaeroarchaeum sp.]